MSDETKESALWSSEAPSGSLKAYGELCRLADDELERLELLQEREVWFLRCEAHRSAAEAAEKGAKTAEAELERVTKERDALALRLHSCLARLGYCEISLGVYDDGQCSEYWVRYPDRITADEVRAVEEHCPTQTSFNNVPLFCVKPKGHDSECYCCFDQKRLDSEREPKAKTQEEWAAYYKSVGVEGDGFVHEPPAVQERGPVYTGMDLGSEPSKSACYHIGIWPDDAPCEICTAILRHDPDCKGCKVCQPESAVEIPLPAPTFIGMDLASGPDRTSYRCLNCGSFEVDLVPEFMNQLTCLNCGTRYSPSL